VSKTQVAESGDYNLSGDRYKVNSNIRNSGWPLVSLGEIVDILNGFAFKSDLYTNKGTRVIRITNVQKGFVKDDDPKYYPESFNAEIGKYLLKENDLLVSLTGNVGRVALLPSSFLPAALNQRVACLRITDETQILEQYLFHLLNLDNFEQECINASSGVAQKNLSTEWLKTFEIPLPPLEVQEQIVAELDSYAAIISGARQILENWRPRVVVSPSWKSYKLDEVATIDWGNTNLTKSSYVENGPYLGVSATGGDGRIDHFEHEVGATVLSAIGANCGKIFYPEEKFTAIKNTMTITPDTKLINPRFLFSILQANTFPKRGGGQPFIAKGDVVQYQISIPPIDEQERIVELINAEASQVDSAKKLISTYESRTQAVIAKLWNE